MKIREVIERHGMTMADLAKKRGQTNSAVVQLVKGNPTISKLRELAQDVGCNFWEFIEDEIEAAGYSIVRNGLQPASTDNVEPVADDAAEQEQARQADTDAETKAEEACVLRFTYDCPHCGEAVKITIEKS